MAANRKKYNRSTIYLNDRLNKKKYHDQSKHQSVPYEHTQKKKRKDETPRHSKDNHFLEKYKWVIVAFFFILLILTGGAIGLLMRRPEFKKTKDLTPPSGPNPCDGFDLYAGNIANAKTVVLAEIHCRKNETIACADKILNFKGLEGKHHFYRLEGVPVNEIVKCDELRMRPERICKGWDSEDKILMHYRLLALINTMVSIRNDYEDFLHSYQQTYKIADLDREADFFLDKEIIAQGKLVKKDSQKVKVKDLSLHPFTHEKVNYVYHRLCLEQLKEIKRQRQTGMSYHDIFLPYATYKEILSEGDEELLSALYDYDLPGRNKFLADSLIEDLGIFKIAQTGLCHVVPDEMVCNQNAIESLESVHSTLAENEDKNPYAILVMRK